MLDEQGGLCAMCKVAPAAHVDHDHVTGAVRALLCFNCNGGLGQFRDDPVLLHAAAYYVSFHRVRQAIRSGGSPGLESPAGAAPSPAAPGTSARPADPQRQDSRRPSGRRTGRGGMRKALPEERV